MFGITARITVLHTIRAAVAARKTAGLQNKNTDCKFDTLKYRLINRILI